MTLATMIAAATLAANAATNAAPPRASAFGDDEPPAVREARERYEKALREADAALEAANREIERSKRTTDRYMVGPLWQTVPKGLTKEERWEYECRQRAEIIDQLRRIGGGVAPSTPPETRP